MIDLFFDLVEKAGDDKNLFITQIKKLTPILSKESWDILYESFGEFDKKYESKYEVLFYNFKLYLEEEHERKSKNLKGCEKRRFLLRNDPFLVSLEGYCNSCTYYSSVTTGLIQYFESYANMNPNNRVNHMEAKCPNCNCKNGFLNLEFLDKIKFIKEKQDVLNKKKYVQLRIFENELDIVGTVFECIKKGDYTIRAKRLQAILMFLLDNPDNFYKTRELQNILINERKDLFKSSSNTSSDTAETFYKQFEDYFDVFKICDLVEFRESPSVKIESLMVEEYQLSKFGKTIALLAKAQDNDDGNSHLYDDIYQNWLAYFDDQSSSLDLFCKKYFQSCKRLDLLNNFIKFFTNYYFHKHDIFSPTELFTQLIFYRYNNNESNNKKLWEFWKSALVDTNGKRNYFFNHIKLHLDRSLENKVHDFNRYEDARYENRSRIKFVTIEAACDKCKNEYMYLQVPIIFYLKDFFYQKADAISEYANSLQCKRCNNKDFKFILI